MAQPLTAQLPTLNRILPSADILNIRLRRGPWLSWRLDLAGGYDGWHGRYNDVAIRQPLWTYRMDYSRGDCLHSVWPSAAETHAVPWPQTLATGTMRYRRRTLLDTPTLQIAAVVASAFFIAILLAALMLRFVSIWLAVANSSPPTPVQSNVPTANDPER